jgi:hypothetical protein
MANKIVGVNRRTYLKIDNFVVEQRSWGEGFFGNFTRSGSNGYTLEGFLEFDIPSEIPAGSTIEDVTLEITCNTKGSQVSTVNSNLIKQDKTANSVWNTPVRPPKYDDFSTTYWPTILDTIQVNDVGTYQYSSASLTQLVQDWLDGTVDYKDGCIIDAAFNFVGYWLSLDDAELDITYTQPIGIITDIQRKYRLR